jgi:FkbM family methyltransferase
VLTAGSLAELESLVDAAPVQVVATPHAPAVPQLIESHQGYNIVRLSNEYLGLPLTLGQINRFDEQTRQIPGVIVADTLNGARSRIDALQLGALRRKAGAVDNLLFLASQTWTNVVRQVPIKAARVAAKRWLQRAGLARQPFCEFHPPILQFSVWARDDSRDFPDFLQVFRERKFACLQNAPPRGLIVDAGANAGYFSAWCLSNFANCQVLAVEPDSRTFSLLQRNLSPYGHRARLVLARISSPIRKADATDESSIERLDLASVIARSGSERVALLKLDLDSAAVVLAHLDLAWLDKVDAVALELSDETVSDRATEIALEALRERGFAISRHGAVAHCVRHAAQPGRREAA